MTVKTFFIGIIASFALPWIAVVAVPFAKMRNVEIPQYDISKDGKEGPYAPVKSGLIQSGSSIYGAEGCAQCHSQLSRPTYAGNDLGRPDLAGIAKDPELGDTRRESNLWDYKGESYAWIGETRMGPDLSNFGRRMELVALNKNKSRAKELGLEDSTKLPLAEKFNIEMAVNTHLFNPRQDNLKSICPANVGFFHTASAFGQGAINAVSTSTDSETQVIPGSRARTLVSYLLSLKRDDEVPSSINYARNNKKSK